MFFAALLWTAALAVLAAQEVRVFPQVAGYVQSASFSPDGRRVLSGGTDGAVKVWDAKSGALLKAFYGHAGEVRSAAFSPDGRRIASGSQDKTVKIWNAEKFSGGGRELRTLAGHGGGVASVCFSPDGRRVVSASGDRTLKVWDAESGALIRTLSGHEDTVYSAAYSRDGRFIVSGSDDKTVKVWNAETGNLIRTFTGHGDRVYSAAFSPDGRRVVSASRDKSVRIWDAESGGEIRAIKSFDNTAYQAAFSPDGKKIVAAANNMTAGKPMIWDAETGAELRTLSGHTDAVYSAAWSPDGGRVVTGSAGATLKIWNAETGALLRTLAGATDRIRSAVMSRDGRRIAAAGEGRLINIWDAGSGALLRTLEHGGPVYSAAFSPDGRLLAAGAQTASGNLKIWETETGREIRTLSGHTDTVFSVAFSPDGRRLASASGDRTLRVWDAAAGNQLASLSGHSGPISSLAFSPDGRRVVTGSWDTTLKLWDVSSPRPVDYRELRTLRGHSGDINCVAFSPDGRRVASASIDRTLRVWDAESGASLRTLTGHNNWVWSAAFSPDGRHVVSGSDNNDIRIWEAETGRPVRTVTGLLGTAVSLAYTPDGRRILAGALDGTVRLYGAEDGRETAQFVGFMDREWVSITPDGYYAASTKGDGRINVLTNSTVYGIDAYRATFYRPAVLEARLAGLPDPLPASASGIQNAASFEPPVVVIRGPQAGAVFTGPNTELSVSVADQMQSVKTVKVLVNGRLLGGEDMKNLSGSRGLTVEGSGGLSVGGQENRVDFRFPVTLSPGTSRVEVIATNGYSEGKDAVEVTYRAQANQLEILPNLWILAIGINRYDDPAIQNLDYSAADARGIIEAFKSQEGKVYRRVNSLLIADGAAVSPTAENIRDNFSWLRQAGQRDVVLLFIAGHGVNDPGGNFLFLPLDAAFGPDGNLRVSRAISNREIYSVLDVPGQKLVFIDSCHSEGVSGRRTRAVDNNQLVRDLMDNSTVIFTSSRGSELSQESREYGHGLFTWAIMEGMNGEADLIRDGRITMKELDTYVSEKVPALTGGAQHPTTTTPDGYINFNVAIPGR